MSTQSSAPAINLVVEPETKEDLKRAVAAACLMQLASLKGEGHMNQAQEFAIATIGNAPESEPEFLGAFDSSTLRLMGVAFPNDKAHDPQCRVE